MIIAITMILITIIIIIMIMIRRRRIISPGVQHDVVSDLASGNSSL